MKTITWLESTHGDPELHELWEFLARQVEVLAAGRAKTQLRHVSVAAGGIRTPANRLMSDAAILASSLNTQMESDAVVIGCWGAPTEAVRSALSIPVTSLPDASIRALGSLARRAVVVTVAPSLAPIFTDDLVRLGASGFLRDRPVRAYDPESTHEDVLRAISDPTDLIHRFDKAAEEAVRDGADAIVVGCGYLAPIFSAHGYESVLKHQDVPVLDCNRLAFEHALQLLALDTAGIRPTQRGYVRPMGAREDLLAEAAGRLANPGTPKTKRRSSRLGPASVPG